MCAGLTSRIESMEQHQDVELRLLLKLSRRFPQVRGFGRMGGLVARFYNRKERREVVVDVLGHRMALDPKECVDSALLFCPHLYERLATRCLRHYLSPGGRFLDAGANIGFYSLIAADLVGPSGQVLAVEADPFNFRRLERNVSLSNLKDILILRNVGLSDKSEILRLGLNLTGNRGGNSFIDKGDGGVMVRCESLLEVLAGAGVDRIDVAKFDIEGFEHRVLKGFLGSAPAACVPRAIIIEQNPRLLELGAGDALNLLREHGFAVSRIKDQDYLALRN
jgi:FkbM family methyltransferase